MTAGINLLGGAGTFCAAFSNNVGYRMAFKAIMDYRWIYQIVMVLTIPTGIAGIFGLVKYIKGKPDAYRLNLIILVIGTLLGATQYFASLILRGKAIPANVKFFTNAATLVYFLILLIPAIWEMMNDAGPVDKSETNAAGGMAAFIVGALTLTVFFWAGPSHTFFGENWTFVFETPLLIFGTLLVVGGSLIVLREIVRFASGSSLVQNNRLLRILAK